MHEIGLLLSRRCAIMFVIALGCLFLISCNSSAESEDENASGSSFSVPSRSIASMPEVPSVVNPGTDEPGETDATDQPVDLVYPDFVLADFLNMSGPEVLEEIEKSGFVFESTNRWTNESIGAKVIVWFSEGSDAREVLLNDGKYTDLIIKWKFRDITDKEFVEWRMTWENLTDSLIERSGLTGELRQGYVDARNYGAYGISHFQDMDEGYWIVACGPYEFLDCDVFVKISRYSPDEFMSISDKETLLKIINNRMMGTISETIISELPHDETDFSVAYGDKSGETHVLNVTIKNAELSQVEVEARVYEWLEKEFYTPEDFEYTWERATG